MKALALLTAVAVTLFSVAASAQTYGAPYGKGKAPPPPVVTKGQASLGGPAIVPVPFFFAGSKLSDNNFSKARTRTSPVGPLLWLKGNAREDLVSSG
jgi:hypothetical protein